MRVKLLTEHHLEFLSFKGGGCTGSSESSLVKMPHCWKSHVTAHKVARRCRQATSDDGQRKLSFYKLPSTEGSTLLGLKVTIVIGKDSTNIRNKI